MNVTMERPDVTGRSYSVRQVWGTDPHIVVALRGVSAAFPEAGEQTYEGFPYLASVEEGEEIGRAWVAADPGRDGADS